ncbi:hypothetical protein Lfu02_27990 [Longispora fulva]|uniref:Uncharacterized protein n=1 Tax=Longispora fulva TaxID=619741 RepID=A0A8J7GRH8_9ACTN|nr:hypothetical protein [Longispora fulva]MBG6138935.1 hypothetical protein [Longispora fulva]GIG58427.1 hypothetical protein Lfu02_27990 [Longispora fulva]
MVTVDLAEETPADVTDPLLWRDAQFMLRRHSRPDERGLCVWCGRAWSCAPRRLAERAAAAARKPWREAWTARHDIAGMRALPEWRSTEPADERGHLPAVTGVITSSGTNRRDTFIGRDRRPSPRF